jgi:DNA-binding GntR family transcriptional regulator
MSEELQPISRRSTAAIVADRIRSAIMRGTFPPGTQLGEVDLAAQLGVSRGPLREAMQRLVAEGLLRSERHRGLFVRDLDAADVRDVYTARTAVERAAALLLLAAPDRAPAVARLTTAIAAMEAAAADGDAVALADADHEFHAELVAASGSPRLHRMSRTLLVETRMCLAALQQNPPPPESLLAEHRLLRDALEQGDAERMTAVLETHMADAVSRILDVTVVEPAAAEGEPPALPA